MGFNAREYLQFFGFKHITDRGENLMASCPDFKGLHSRGDQKPSFGINKRTGLNNCFMCDTHLNLEQLTAKLLARDLDKMVTEYEAWLWLEEKGWTPEELSVEEVQSKIKDLSSGGTSLEVFDEALLDQFQKGVHPTIIYNRGITIPAAKEWGLMYDPKTKRTVIPVRNMVGQLVGAYSRAVDDNHPIKHAVGIPQPDGQPALLNFKKHLVLYGENKLYKHQTLLVVETPLDVVYGWGHGVVDQLDMDIAAIMGVKASIYHIERMLPYQEVILALDNDTAGQEGTETLIKQLRGKVKLMTFDNFGEKDLGDIPADDLLGIRKAAQDITVKKFADIPYKR